MIYSIGLLLCVTVLLTSDFTDAGWMIVEDYVFVNENESNVTIYNATYTSDGAGCDEPPPFSAQPNFVSTMEPVVISTSPNTWSVEVKLLEPLDADTGDTSAQPFTLTAQTTCIGQIDATITLNVVDVIDSPPSFVPESCTANISENAAVNSVVVEGIQATDTDHADTFVYGVQLLSEAAYFDYVISPDGVNITLKGNLDYETKKTHTFTITATDSVGLIGTCDVIINVENEPDAGAVFSLPVYMASIQEGTDAGTRVVQVSASDSDGLDDGSIRYSILTGGGGMFQIDGLTGEVTTQVTIDAEDTAVVNGVVVMTINAYEQDPTSVTNEQGDTTATAELRVEIIDVDDNVPTFSSVSFTATISNLAKVGDYVTVSGSGFIDINDLDQDTNNEFSIRVERDGVPWSVFRPSLESAHGQASVLLVLEDEEILQELSGTDVTFQIVAESISTAGIEAGAATAAKSTGSFSTSANVKLSVVAATPTSLASQGSDGDISTTDIVIIVLIFLVIVNIVVTLLVLHRLRQGQSIQLPFFRRGSKYYVSERGNIRSPVSVVDGGSRATSSPGAIPDMALDTPTFNGGRSEEMREVTNDAYETLNSKGGGKKLDRIIVLTSPRPSDTPNNTVTAASDTPNNTVTAAANRNRCDVIPISERELQAHQVAIEESGPGGRGDAPPVSTNQTQDTLMSLLDKPEVGQRCDVAKMGEVKGSALTTGTTQVSPGAESTGSNGYVNLVQTTPRCDVAPLDRDVGSGNQGLSDLLKKVHEKLASSGSSEKCNVVPLQSADTSLGPSPISNTSQSESRTSSFSGKSTTDVVPLIAPQRKPGSKQSKEKQDDKEDKSTLEGYNNLAFTSTDKASIKANTATHSHPPCNGSSRLPPSGNTPSLASGDSVKQTRAITTPTSAKPSFYPGTSQVSNPDVPPVALALPSFSGTTPVSGEQYTVIVNPVYEPYVSTATQQEQSVVRKQSNQGRPSRAVSTTPVQVRPNDVSPREETNPSDNFMTKAKSLLSEAALSKVDESREATLKNGKVATKTVRIVEENNNNKYNEADLEKRTSF